MFLRRRKSSLVILPQFIHYLKKRKTFRWFFFFQTNSAHGLDDYVSTKTLPRPERSSPNNIFSLTLIFRHVPRLNICSLVELANTAMSTVQITSLMLGRVTLSKNCSTKREAALWEIEVYTTCIYWEHWERGICGRALCLPSMNNVIQNTPLSNP